MDVMGAVHAPSLDPLGVLGARDDRPAASSSRVITLRWHADFRLAVARLMGTTTPPETL